MFRKINVGNDWMHFYYSFGPVLTPGGMASASLGTIVFRDGQEVRVRWPSGKEETTRVVLRRERGTYGDMGHDYEYSNDVPYVRSSLNGTDVFTKLADLELWDDAAAGETKGKP